MITTLFALLLSASPPDTPITDAVAACVGQETGLSGPLVDDDFSVLDDGHSLVVEQDERVFDAFDCVSEELGLPEWVRPLMNGTAGQGLVTVGVEGFTVMWLFDPDRGPLVVLYDAEAS